MNSEIREGEYFGIESWYEYFLSQIILSETQLNISKSEYFIYQVYKQWQEIV
jgi:hypothetical protein